jgi:hypothetical protein
MFYVVCGAAVVTGTCAAYWYLLPRNGQENPLVRNSDVGSMLTIGLMTALTLGIALLLDGLFG